MSDPKVTLWHPHPLVRDSADNGWACDGRSQPDRCRRGITGFNQTSGVPRYRCAPCDYDLCDACLTASLSQPVLEPEKKTELVAEEKEKKKVEDFLPTLLEEQFGVLVEQTKFSDVLFHVGEKKIPAHRLILALASPVFEAMLYTRKPGTNEYEPTLEKAPLEVKLKGVEPEIFQTLLKCVYTDKVAITASNIQGLMKAANKYNVERLRVACSEFMEGDVTTENILDLFQIAPAMLGDEEFGLSFIAANIEELTQQPGWLTLPKDRLALILKDDHLAIEEIALFNALLRWGEAEVKRKIEKKEENVTCKAVVADLLPLIRFPVMELAHVASVVAPANVLEQAQLVGLFSYVSVQDEKGRAPPGFPTIPRTGGGGELFTWDTKKHGRSVTLSNNNLTATTSTGGWNRNLVLGSREFKSGNHYWEVKLDFSTGDMIGVVNPSISTDLTSTYTTAAHQVFFVHHSNGVYGGTGLSPTSVGVYAKTGDTLGFALTFNKTSSTFDMTVYKNRVSIGTPFRNIPSPVVAATEFCSSAAKATLIPKAKKP